MKKISLDEKLIIKILENDAKDIGVFMSILAYSYIKMCDISNEDYLKSMKNSLKEIKKWEEKNEKKDI